MTQLTGDEIEKIYLAVTLGQDNPIDTDAGRALYEELHDEIDRNGEVEWRMPKN